MDGNDFLRSLGKKLNPAASFNIGGAGIIPRLSLEGSGSMSKNPTKLPDGYVDILHNRLNASGEVGLDAYTPGGHNFGAGVKGNYSKGMLEFPSELQNLGALPKIKYGTRGVDAHDINAYYNSPDGFGIRGNYNPGTNDINAYFNTPNGLGIRGNYNPDTDDYSVYGNIKVDF
tara:strand:- start:65 stop:583 length:519 start_codon:yes stop_codon:yes gene_type:complete